MSSRTTPNFCSQCGASLSPSDAFCSSCGTAVGDGATSGETTADTTASGPSSKTARGRRDFRRRVEDLAVDGWDVKHDYGDRVVMVNRGIGSVPMHALLFVTTSGVGNLLYAWYSYSLGAERVELRADGTERYSSDDYDTPTEWDLKSAIGVAGGLTLAATFALAGLLLLWVTSSLVMTGLSLAFLLAGLVSVPFGTQFAPGFESPTTFGRRRTTDSTVANAPNRPCSACSRPVGTGVRRTYAECRYVAGIPVETLNEGENCYCRTCANGDPFERNAGNREEREKSAEFA
ncbi:zinc ribbon domain-containing protein [Halorussus lipolyticus]|uniref:zinc ribbon domain-containing protein n=1 Tax=Halorussus lipolyticus TaxID=3034024 RepID=UPI0023E828E2|nr:zinc ribbon domain-containing protein [Halorussus sp. DT80]